MTDNLLERLAGRDRLPSPPGDGDSASVTDTPCFGWIRRGTSWNGMLQLRKRTGNILAIAYHAIESMEFNPSEGIIIHARGRRILISGRLLNGGGNQPAPLFDLLSRQRVAWVQESKGSDTSITDCGAADAIELDWQ